MASISVKNIFWGVIGGVVTIFGLAAAIWAISSFWHCYVSAEMLHEKKQDTEISTAIETAQFAMKQSTQTLIQNRQNWLQQQIAAMEKDFGGYNVPKAPPSIKKIYNQYKLEWERNQKKLDKLMEGS
jgi:hypothetical protein